MIALFARANHPRDGWSFAHGYVVVGVRCDSLVELQRVRDRIAREGLRLPDQYRIRHLHPATFIDWSGHEWYSGGPGAFDYLGTFTDAIDSPEPSGISGSKGDNRFFWIYTAAEVVAAGPESEAPSPERNRS